MGFKGSEAIALNHWFNCVDTAARKVRQRY
jgi:hypothetical protein